MGLGSMPPRTGPSGGPRRLPQQTQQSGIAALASQMGRPAVEPQRPTMGGWGGGSQPGFNYAGGSPNFDMTGGLDPSSRRLMDTTSGQPAAPPNPSPIKMMDTQTPQPATPGIRPAQPMPMPAMPNTAVKGEGSSVGIDAGGQRAQPQPMQLDVVNAMSNSMRQPTMRPGMGMPGMGMPQQPGGKGGMQQGGMNQIQPAPQQPGGKGGMQQGGMQQPQPMNQIQPAPAQSGKGGMQQQQPASPGKGGQSQSPAYGRGRSRYGGGGGSAYRSSLGSKGGRG